MKRAFLFAVVVLLFASVFVQEGLVTQVDVPNEPRTSEIDENAKKLAIAVMPNAPKVSIGGKVFLPDGSPASECIVTIYSVAFTFAQNFSSKDGELPPTKDKFSITTHGTGGIVKPDGTFKINDAALPGANVVITIHGWADKKNKQFVSKPVSFVAREDMEPLNITLAEGIPVRGKIIYDSGTPAADRGLSFDQRVEPKLGAEFVNMKELLTSSLTCTSNSEGEYERFLLPGDYTIRDFSGRRKELLLTIAKTDKEKRVDWTLPTPIIIETEMEDGSPTGGVWYSSGGEHSRTSSSDATGSFVLEPVTRDGILVLTSSRRNQGTIEKITPAMVGKTTRFKLKPMATVAITLIDVNGKPVVGERVHLSLQIRTFESSFSHAICNAVTNSSGTATMSVPPGKLPAVIRLPGSFERLLPGTGREIRSDLEHHLDMTPGSTLHLGTMTLTKVFSE